MYRSSPTCTLSMHVMSSRRPAIWVAAAAPCWLFLGMGDSAWGARKASPSAGWLANVSNAWMDVSCQRAEVSRRN